MAQINTKISLAGLYTGLSYETLLRERAKCMSRVDYFNDENNQACRLWHLFKDRGETRKADALVLYGRTINAELSYELDTLSIIEDTLRDKLDRQEV